VIEVESGAGSYPVHLVEGGLEGLGEALSARLRPRRALLVTNPVVGALYGQAAEASLEAAGWEVRRAEVPDGEARKDLDTWEKLVTDALALGVDRATPLVALGGGVTGDLAGFAAATLLRGLPLVQVPTTLLAMVDSSVGGKTGVNTPRGKNLVGAFHAPILVYAALGTLATLPAEELRCGLGELVKHGLLDADLFALLEREAEALAVGDPAALARVLGPGLRVKADIVARDEREEGDRALLNLGHTVGHAIETAAGHGALRHGEAVAMGLLAELRWAAGEGHCAPEVPRRLAALMKRLGLADRPPPLPRDALMMAALVDKKRRSGMLRLPIVRSVGEAALIDIPVDALPGIFVRVPDAWED